MITVGYGDIGAQTDSELMFSSIWMFGGSFFFTFAIGNLSSVLSSMDTRETSKANKLATLNEFCKEAKLDKDLRERLKKSIEYSSTKNFFSWIEKHKVFSELPSHLKS
jgi:hypothetical protein